MIIVFRSTTGLKLLLVLLELRLIGKWIKSLLKSAHLGLTLLLLQLRLVLVGLLRALTTIRILVRLLLLVVTVSLSLRICILFGVHTRLSPMEMAFVFYTIY